MKTKTYLFALMAMALTLGSCSDNENGIGGETSKYITVSTSIGNMTRVATDAKGGQTFEEGDEISVYAWTGDATAVPAATGRVVDNAINKLTKGSWISTPQMLWKNNRDKHYFIGVYPKKAISDLAAGEYVFDAIRIFPSSRPKRRRSTFSSRSVRVSSTSSNCSRKTTRVV